MNPDVAHLHLSAQSKRRRDGQGQDERRGVAQDELVL